MSFRYFESCQTVQSRTCEAIVPIIYAPIADFAHYVDDFPQKSPVNVDFPLKYSF
jgi:hypothetical protein